MVIVGVICIWLGFPVVFFFHFSFLFTASCLASADTMVGIFFYWDPGIAGLGHSPWIKKAFE